MRLRKAAFGAMLKQEMGWFDSADNSTGQIWLFESVLQKARNTGIWNSSKLRY